MGEYVREKGKGLYDKNVVEEGKQAAEQAYEAARERVHAATERLKERLEGAGSGSYSSDGRRGSDSEEPGTSTETLRREKHEAKKAVKIEHIEKRIESEKQEL